MRRLRAIVFRSVGFFHKRRQDRELARELDAHLQLHIEENLRAGMSPAEARRHALLKLGGLEQTKQLLRDRRSLPLLETLSQDLHFGLRMLRKNPSVTTVVVLTLAIGVGANTAIFDLVNGILLERLPVPHPEQIAALVIQSNASALGALGFSYPEFVEFRQQAAPFCEVFGQALGRVNLTADRHTNTLAISGVSTNYFAALGVKPALGRLILPGEGERPGEPALLVLDYSFWQKRFGGAPQVIGKQVRLEGRPATIVGVTQKEFHGQFSTFEMDAFIPLSTSYPDQSPNSFWSSRSIHMAFVGQTEARRDHRASAKPI